MKYYIVSYRYIPYPDCPNHTSAILIVKTSSVVEIYAHLQAISPTAYITWLQEISETEATIAMVQLKAYHASLP